MQRLVNTDLLIITPVFSEHVLAILANNIIGRLPMNIGKRQSLKFTMLDGNNLLPCQMKAYSFEVTMLRP
nr:hypothetical protein [Tanacetum cinerariifolium]